MWYQMKPTSFSLSLSLYTRPTYKQTRGVSHCSLAIYTKKSILRQKTNYENSNISPCKNIIFKKMLEKEPKSFKISELCKLISSFNTSQNISSFKNPHIKIGPIIIT